MYLIIFFLALIAAFIFHWCVADKVKRHLSYAGWHRPQAYVIFIVSSLLLIAVVLLWTFSRLNALPPGESLTFISILSFIIPLLLAVVLPFWVVNLSERQYQAALRKEVSYIINFFIIYLEAGYTVDQTLERLLVVLQKYHFKFAKELLLTWHDLRYLGSRSAAWQGLLDRLGNREWLSFVRLLQKEELHDRYLIDSFVRESETLHALRMSTIEYSVIKSSNYAIALTWIFFLPILAIALLGPIVAFVFG